MPIRAATPRDLPAIAAIQGASPEASQWKVEDYLAYHLAVAEEDGRVAGFLAARRVADGEFEILNVAVAPESRRRGVARALVGAFLSGLRGVVYLEVRESNTAARELYEGLNFQTVGLRPEYYSAPLESGVVMKFHSC